MEEWRDIKGYEGIYQVSNEGRIKRFTEKGYRFLSGKYDGSDYKEIVLCGLDSRKRVKIHRLVAEAFIPNPNNYPYINHKNERKDDNRVENLEWCTPQYNSNYSIQLHKDKYKKYQKKKYKPHKTIVQLSINGELVNYYKSISEAGRNLNTRESNIRHVLKGEHITARGFKWRYATEEEIERWNKE